MWSLFVIRILFLQQELCHFKEVWKYLNICARNLSWGIITTVIGMKRRGKNCSLQKYMFNHLIMQRSQNKWFLLFAILKVLRPYVRGKHSEREQF